ncbi:MAG: hypothetical protein Kow0029_12190 [Candidatus Rifleibacteriota bacterium]
MSSIKPLVNNLFSEMHRHIEVLLKETPVFVIDTLKENAYNSFFEGFLQLKKLPGRHIEVDEKPVIIATLVGPSGSGKSTIFNLLTGLDTPAGGMVRPMTFSSTVAIPSQIYNKFDHQTLFPGFELVELFSPSDLYNKNTPVNQIFKSSYQQPRSDFWLCLVDIPDFNTTETTNWTKAEQMIERADAVIFTVYTEAYKDQKTYEFLKKCCRFSGNLSYILTKIDSQNPAESAKEVRTDLISTAGKDKDFTEKRANDITLLTYLTNAPFYYSQRANKPEISNFYPIANTDLTFSEFLFSQKGLEIILSHYLQSISVGINSCREICCIAQKRSEKVQKILYKVENQITKASQKIVGEEFPIFYVLAMIRKMLEEHRPGLLQRLIRPISILGQGIRQAINTVQQKIRDIKPEDLSQEIRQRNQLERQRLQKEIEKLIEKWRDSGFGDQLGMENCRFYMNEFLKLELPPVDDEWELFVREKLEDWCQKNKNRWVWINVINEFLILAGTGLFMADLFIGGGIGSLGLVAVYGGGTAAGGFLTSLVNNLGLALEIQAASNRWKELRQQTYCNFIKSNLAKPLFLGPLEQEAETLNRERLNKCFSSCDKLEEISQKYEFRKS